MNMNVRKGDNVIVLTGKDKGKTGKVLAVNPDNGRVIVEGVNIATCHVKPRSAQQTGGKIKKESGIDSSNVQIVCPGCSHSVRVRHNVVDGKKIRVCAKCGASLEVAVKVEKGKKKTVVNKKTKKEGVDKKEAPVKENKKLGVTKRSMNKESGDGR